MVASSGLPRTADGDAFRFRAGRVSLDLCSTVLWRHVQPAEQLRSPDDLTRWRSEAGLGDSRPPLTEADLAGARELREAIYRLVTARVDGARLPECDVAAVNAAARPPCRTPRLGLRGELRWEDGEPLTAALSAVARDAIDLIGGPQAARLRECAAPDCAFLFVDTSRSGGRRWCAATRCGNREHVRKHRSRPGAADGRSRGRDTASEPAGPG
jgi:predicted RNA-binding Zn ribbon-like protein